LLGRPSGHLPDLIGCSFGHFPHLAGRFPDLLGRPSGHLPHLAGYFPDLLGRPSGHLSDLLGCSFGHFTDLLGYITQGVPQSAQAFLVLLALRHTFSFPALRSL
jgi:hypothetical protein